MQKNSAIIKKIVREMGGTIEKIVPERSCFLIKIAGEKILFSRKFQIASDFFSGRALTAHKDLTYVALKENDLPTPGSVCFYKKSISTKNIATELALLNYPIVIKDANGSNSKGVFVNIKNLVEAKEIIFQEINNFPYLIAQEMVFGKEFRVLVLGNKVIGVLEMIPPRIFGNAKNTIRELIEIKQLKMSRKTACDITLNKILELQGFNLESILKKDQTVFIKNNACLAEGGETKDATSLINLNIEILCVKAAKATGKNLAGIDIICDDISKNPSEQAFSILEINGKPDLYIHYNPTHGKTQNVIKPIIDFILSLKKTGISSGY
jgi:cyanophycin synthetase